MTAVLIPTASEAEWLAARRQGITASEIAVVMGLAPESYGSAYKLYHQKLGLLPPDEDNLVLRVGRHNEPLVCELFAEQHPEFAVQGDGRALYAHPGRRWQMATPDRTVCDIRFDFLEGVSEIFEEYEPYAVLEAKTAASYDGWGDDGTDEIPVHYRCQVLWQMDVMGVTTAFVACLFLHARQLRVYEITLDDAAEADLKLMREEAMRFLFGQVATGNPPDVDWRPATIDALKALHPSVDDDVTAGIGPQLADRYEAACRNTKKWEQRKHLYEAQIRERIGNARRIVRLGPGEIPVARRDVYDVREHVRKAATVDKLVPVYPKESKTS